MNAGMAEVRSPAAAPLVAPEQVGLPQTPLVIPAKAGIQRAEAPISGSLPIQGAEEWFPAFAGP